jgi:hypothetical protein
MNITPATSDEWAKHIAILSKSNAESILNHWQNEYYDDVQLSKSIVNPLASRQKEWERYHNNFVDKCRSKDCIWVAKELDKSEKAFEYGCLTYWKNTGKTVPDAISAIAVAIALFQMVKWLQEQNLPVQSNKKNGISKLKAFDTLKDAFVNDEAEKMVYKILFDNTIIDKDNVFIAATAVKLYSYIKRLNELGYFKKITDINLHGLINNAFSCDSVMQNYKQAPAATLKETPRFT